MARRRPALRRLSDEVAQRFPDLDDPVAEIHARRILVDGRIAPNPGTLVRRDASVSRRVDAPLRGEAKLRAALARFAVPVAGRAALDCGAAAGGFTRTLLAAGARRVYAVDAGYGQLRGSLRADPRVVTMERTNLAELDRSRVPEPIDLVTLDLSYLAIALAVPQLDRVELAAGADLVALVKPMYELGLEHPPRRRSARGAAVAAASAGVGRAGWVPLASMRSPVPGAGGAIEYLLHARRV
ncbi:MAG TPA: SAM-dependent methyltransferase [Gaiellales bacterium]|jgi:23S rRNA (cytidine1920-2'-O)/16S rRNA (cytidine1409-2'-O)-methyltransferase|nr:SAM-dependent methyltransferase [Gaiellales bacterium]